MPRRWCAVQPCNELVTVPATRCPKHQAERDARPSSSSRGLGWSWSARKQADAEYQAAEVCGDCGQAFSPDNPKTGEHVVPRSRGGDGSGPIPALCRRCNSSRGGRLR